MNSWLKGLAEKSNFLCMYTFGILQTNSPQLQTAQGSCTRYNSTIALGFQLLSILLYYVNFFGYVAINFYQLHEKIFLISRESLIQQQWLLFSTHNGHLLNLAQHRILSTMQGYPSDWPQKYWGVIKCYRALLFKHMGDAP